MEKFALPDAVYRAAEEVIEQERRLIIKAYGIIHTTEDFMRAFVQKIMARFARPDLAPAVEIIIKELTMNAVKANFKKIFFIENQLDISDPAQYAAGMARFPDIMTENVFVTYGRKARAMQLKVETSFDFNKDRVIIEVRNNTPMVPHEEQRVREKMQRALRYGDMGQFLMENLDETEGAGAGLALCLTTMQSAGIDPRLLSLYSDLKTETIARAEIPLHAAYVPTRRRWQAALAG
ncbi:MAG: hypothetical protein OHK0011_25490 [Turneriella sp.]